MQNALTFKPSPFFFEPFVMNFNCGKHGEVRITAMKGRDGKLIEGCCPQCEKEREAEEKRS